MTTQAQQVIQAHQTRKSVEMLLGMVTGFIADGQLHDLEIKLLATWLAENKAVALEWPGSLIARKVNEIMADGRISETERAHLLEVLQELAVNDFANTGSASAEVLGLPINDAVTVEMTNAGVCHTGTFLYGTRAACERLTLSMGGMPVDAISRKTDILVVGTRVSPGWINTSFGRKLQHAVELQEQGHGIEIISERRWLSVAGL